MSEVDGMGNIEHWWLCTRCLNAFPRQPDQHRAVPGRRTCPGELVKVVPADLHREAVEDGERLRSLGTALQRDRRESDKVLAYALEVERIGNRLPGGQ